MVTRRRFRPFASSTGESATADFGSPVDDYYRYDATLPQFIFTASSTPGFIGLTSNFGSDDCFTQGTLLRKIMSDWSRIAGNQEVPARASVLSVIAIDLTETCQLVERHFSPENVIATCDVYTENHPNSTNSNNIPINYDETFSAKTAQKVSELTYLLKNEAVEDGYFHPAEWLIEDSLKLSKFDPNHWVYTAYSKNIDTEPALAACVLRLLGRFPRSEVGEWGMLLAIHGLSHRDIKVRDASVRALERWGGRKALDALKVCVDIEPTPWLAAYIRQVIRDFED